jgi:glyoxylate reductase
VKKRVLITNRLPEIAYQKLSKRFEVTWNKKQLTEAQLIQKIKPFNAVLSNLADPFTHKVLKAAIHLECVSNFAVGYNNIDLKAAKDLGIWVTNTPDVLTEATADLAWTLILSAARRLPEGERLVRAQGLKGWKPFSLLGTDLAGKTLGIYGFGRIGKAVAYRGKGWNMPVLYHQRHRESASVERRYNAKYVPFEILLKRSDILSVNCPLTPETKGRFTSKEFKLMKHNSIFINTSRGLVHNEKDLAQALKTKTIANAGLDVYQFEPKVNPVLLKLDNCTLLPHVGSATVQTRNAMALLAVDNIERILSGRQPKTPVKL